MNIAWLHLPFSILYVLLIVRFFIAIFEPGIPQLDILFQFVNPVLPLMDRIIAFAAFPVTLIIGFVKGFLPEPVLFWFPNVPADQLFYTVLSPLASLPFVGGLFLSLKTLSYSDIFPGTIQWALPLMYCFWAMLERPLISLAQRIADLVKPKETHWSDTYVASLSKEKQEEQATYSVRAERLRQIEREEREKRGGR